MRKWKGKWNDGILARNYELRTTSTCCLTNTHHTNTCTIYNTYSYKCAQPSWLPFQWNCRKKKRHNSTQFSHLNHRGESTLGRKVHTEQCAAIPFSRSLNIYSCFIALPPFQSNDPHGISAKSVCVCAGAQALVSCVWVKEKRKYLDSKSWKTLEM